MAKPPKTKIKTITRSKTPPLVLNEKLYIPRSLVNKEDLQASFERHLFNESGCAKCDIYKDGDRFCDTCATCENHLGFYRTWGRTKLDTTGKLKSYYYVPSGYKEYIEQSLGIDIDTHKTIDLRSDVKAKNPLTFTGRLYDGTEVINKVKMANQRKLVKKFWEEKRGIIKSAPRTGKTVCITRLLCAFKRKTLFPADEIELLRQALKTIRAHTNVRELEKKTGRKIIGIIQHESDWKENWDIVLCTYQKFIRKGTGEARLQKHVKNKFGLLVVDEIHKAAAVCFSRLINNINTKYKFGVTATVQRKDQAEFLIEQIIGPVVAENKSVSMIPTLYVHETKFKPKYEWKGRAAFVYANTWLAKNKKRNVMLVKQVFADLRENKRNCIIIPALRIAHVKKLVKMINHQAKINNDKRGEKWSQDLAIEYHGKSDKKAVMAAAREGKKTRVVVAFRTMVEKGIDVPCWTHMYMIFPMSNDTNFYQMTQRICTPLVRKPDPVLRIFVDEIGLSKGCFSSTFNKSILKYKYKMSNETRQLAYKLMKRKTIGPDPDIGSGRAMDDW